MEISQLTGVTSTHLIKFNDDNWLYPDTVEGYFNLKHAALFEGFDIQIASGFRSYQRQLQIWNQKWLGQRPILDTQGQVLNSDQLSDKDKLFAILQWSAIPGTSRHHWGTDIDIYDAAKVSIEQLQLTPQEYEQANGPCYELYQWLKEHLPRFRFFFPYAQYQGGVQREPWHISYRPVALQFQFLQSKTLYGQLIEQSEIEGKEEILLNIDEIYNKYIINITR